MKILLLTRYGRLGVTSRIRFLQYLPYFKDHGVEVHVAPFLGDDYVESLYKGTRNWMAVAAAYCRRLRELLSARKYDLLWIEKELVPWAPALPELLIHRYVVDYDDAVFHNYDLHSSPVVRSLLANKIQTVMSRAAAVVVGNDYLGEYARRAGAVNIHFVPTVVDLNRYPLRPVPKNDFLTIGWIGTPWTARYLPAVAPALREVCHDGRARVLLIGSGEIRIPGVPVEVRPWSESTEVEDIHCIDAGIMPLPDEPYERGKCGYKILQYMACERPPIASPVGANRQIINHGVTGFLASTHSEWVRALEDLKKDHALRLALGKAARLEVEQTYSLQTQAPRVLKILENARLASQPKSP